MLAKTQNPKGGEDEKGRLKQTPRSGDCQAITLSVQPVPLSYGTEGPGKRHPQTIRPHERGIARRRRRHGKTPFLKNANGAGKTIRHSAIQA